MGVSVTIRLTEDMAGFVDAWRLAQKDPPTRPEAIRQLVLLGLLKDKGL
jgi:hypothetical protein